MKLVQVLGPGCARCQNLLKNAQEAVKQLGIEAEIEKVSDMNMITSFGVMMPHALVIEGELKLQGKVASVEEIKRLLQS